MTMSTRLVDASFFDASIQLYEAAKAYIDYCGSSGSTHSLQIPVSIKTAVSSSIKKWRSTIHEAGYNQNGGPKPMASYNINCGKSLIETGDFLAKSLEANGGMMGPMVFAYMMTSMRYRIFNTRLEWFGCSLSSCFLEIGRQLIEGFQQSNQEKGSIVSTLEPLLKPYSTSMALEAAIREGGVEILKQGWELVKEVDKEVKQAVEVVVVPPQLAFSPGREDGFVGTNCVHTSLNSGFNINIGSGQQHNGDAELVMVQSGSSLDLGSGSGSGLGCTYSLGNMPMLLLQGNNWVNVGSYNANTGSGCQGVHMATPKASLRKE